jgi:pyruvate ferredoxin oxidoreductase gamma subunit
MYDFKIGLNMIEIRIHGRGGQGSAVAVQILAAAAFAEGNYSRAFIAVGGGDRRGAPIVAFCKIDKEKIREQTKIQNPDFVLVQDVSLINVVNVFEGIKPGGTIVINTEKELEVQTAPEVKVVAVPASKIAYQNIGLSITNTTMLGAFAAVSNSVSINAIKKAIVEKFPGPAGEKNATAAQKTYDYLKQGQP